MTRAASRLPLVLAAVAAVILALVLAAPAPALVDASQVRQSDVAVDAAAPLSDRGRERLEDAARRLREDGAPTKFVVLDQRPSDPVAYARSLRREVGAEWNVLVLSNEPRNLSIASGLSSGTIDDVFRSAVPTLREDAVGGTILVADRLAAAASGSAAGGGSGSEGSGGSGWTLLVLLGLLVAGGLVVFAVVRRKQRKAGEQAIRDERAALEPLVDALAVQVNDLEQDVPMAAPDRAAAAKADADEAILAYGEARDAVEVAVTPAQIGAVRGTLERGLHAANRARAHLEGRPVEEADQEPLISGLCTFNPKHGKATRTAAVTAPTGEDVDVPVCDACAEALEKGEPPDVREVEQNGRPVPYWQGRGLGGPGLGPVLGGALAGVLLGGMFGGPAQGYGAPSEDWSGGGDVGGDFGGGFGGGDFGGGFGGGDFGGGGGF